MKIQKQAHVTSALTEELEHWLNKEYVLPLQEQALELSGMSRKVYEPHRLGLQFQNLHITKSRDK